MSERKYYNEEMETMEPAKLVEIEEGLLKDELSYIYERSPFYREKWDEAGIGPGDFSKMEDLARFPFTTKDDLRKTQEELGGLGGHRCCGVEELVRIQGTSGTTGRPLYIGLTKNDAELWKELFARHAWTGGIRPGDSFINPANFTLFVGGLSESVSAEAMGFCVIPAPLGSTGLEKLFELIVEFKPTVLFATPSATVFLADYVRDTLKKDPKGLGFKKGFMAGEALTEEDRATIEETWGIVARNYYGLADVAADLASECEYADGMHLCGAGAVTAEIVDPITLEPKRKEDGVEGEIVYTTIRREATPVIRYRCRDMVRAHFEKCRCGRTSMRFAVIGRSDDMLKVKGVNVFPSAVKDVVSSFIPRVTGEMRIVLYEPGPAIGTNLEIKVEYGEEVTEGESESIAQEIKEEIKKKLVFTPIIKMIPPQTLPRSQYKIEYFEIAYEKDEVP
jgi:phenylacetate-CoA ligase